MKNNWNQNEANNFIKLYKQKNISKDLALRVYTTQLLGKNNKLVLHGGGNTSLKTTAKIFLEKKLTLCMSKVVVGIWDQLTLLVYQQLN